MRRHTLLLNCQNKTHPGETTPASVTFSCCCTVLKHAMVRFDHLEEAETGFKHTTDNVTIAEEVESLYSDWKETHWIPRSSKEPAKVP